MAIITILLFVLKLQSFEGESGFPELNTRYSIDFGQDLRATAVFISDSEMVYGDEDERGSYKHVTVEKLGGEAFAVRWKDRNGIFDVEHRYDLEQGTIRSRTTDCAGHEFELSGTFKKVD